MNKPLDLEQFEKRYHISPTTQPLLDEAKRLRAENARLREALEEIAGTVGFQAGHLDWPKIVSIGNAARAALEKDKP